MKLFIIKTFLFSLISAYLMLRTAGLRGVVICRLCLTHAPHKNLDVFSFQRTGWSSEPIGILKTDLWIYRRIFYLKFQLSHIFRFIPLYSNIKKKKKRRVFRTIECFFFVFPNITLNICVRLKITAVSTFIFCCFNTPKYYPLLL